MVPISLKHMLACIYKTYSMMALLYSRDRPGKLSLPDVWSISHKQLAVGVKGIYAGLVMVEAKPHIRSISHEQLVIEVKGIYAGLVMVEATCIDVDQGQSTVVWIKQSSKRSM